MRPCDCPDYATVQKLNEQGLRFNEWGIMVSPNSVIIENGTTTMRIPMRRFKAFAEWYLEDQEID